MHRGLLTVMIRPLLVHAMLEWIERNIRFANLDASGLHVTIFQKQQELQKKGIQMVILRLGSATDKMIEVFKQQYGNNSPGALKVHVFDPRKDAKRLRCIVSGSSVASYGSSISKLSQAKAIQCV